MRSADDALTLDVAERAIALVDSACSADIRRARALLDADPSLARHDIACACATGDADDVRRRLDRSPELARTPAPPHGYEPILYACFSRLLRAEPARAPGIRAAVRALLEAGADPNASFDHEGWLQVPLYGAAGIANDAELTRILVDAGADPNDVRPGGGDDDRAVGEALYHAVEFPDTTCAALLVDAGTEPRVVDYCLGRALNFADPATVEMLCARGARASAGNLHQAVFKRRPPSTVGALLDAGAPVDAPDDDGLTPLQLATRWGDAATADLLLTRGADPAAVTDDDRALGAFLAGAPAPPRDATGLAEMLDMATHAGDLAAVRRLLDAGAPVDGDPTADERPLGQASWRGHPAVVAELVSRGARLTWDGGASPIGAALHGSRHCHDPEGGPTMQTVDEIPREPYAQVVRILLDAGAPVPKSLWNGADRPATLIAELGIELPAEPDR
ncbi:MAG TPA: ankyrin repeat domain-containing protein [Solirubrobacteraceae bacterium]